jgi:hypothetical protein
VPISRTTRRRSRSEKKVAEAISVAKKISYSATFEASRTPQRGDGASGWL